MGRDPRGWNLRQVWPRERYDRMVQPAVTADVALLPQEGEGETEVEDEPEALSEDA